MTTNLPIVAFTFKLWTSGTKFPDAVLVMLGRLEEDRKEKEAEQDL